MKKIIRKLDEGHFKQLCRKYDIAAFLIFGSQSTGKTTPLSDLDIAYLPNRTLSDDEENELYVRMLKLFNRNDIDLVDLTKADIILKFSVVLSGKVVACTGERALYNFIVETRRDYLDTNYIRSVFSYYMSKRIKEEKFGESK